MIADSGTKVKLEQTVSTSYHMYSDKSETLQQRH